MSKITIEDIRNFISENKDSEDITKLKKELTGDLTLDTVKGFIETNDAGKNYFQSLTDSKITKAIDTWKTNNLDSIVKEQVDKKVRELNPKMTDEQKMIQDLKDQLDKQEKERKNEKLLNTALSIANEKKLPSSIMNRFLGDDEDTTTQNINDFEKVFNTAVEAKVKETLPNYSTKPDYTGETVKKQTTLESLRTMSKEELIANQDKINRDLSKTE